MALSLSAEGPASGEPPTKPQLPSSLPLQYCAGDGVCPLFRPLGIYSRSCRSGCAAGWTPTISFRAFEAAAGSRRSCALRRTSGLLPWWPLGFGRISISNFPRRSFPWPRDESPASIGSCLSCLAYAALFNFPRISFQWPPGRVPYSIVLCERCQAGDVTLHSTELCIVLRCRGCASECF